MIPLGSGVGGGGLGSGARHCRAKGPNGILVFLHGKTMRRISQWGMLVFRIISA